MSKRIAIFRKEFFNSAHRLHNPALSKEENAQIFGKCNYENYHGHNYELIVKITGEIDAKTGYVIDTKKLSDLIRIHVLDRFDHRNLNLDSKEFKNLNPTVENIALVIYDILRPLINNTCELQITLYETERNFAQYPA
ncbi:MAG: 6-carboxytetrahydropterin synthase [Sphingobacteriaceae bacterium]|nr:6-carboxytetrahydropterin synthase [Sphingobacteriaceae bacterium]